MGFPKRGYGRRRIVNRRPLVLGAPAPSAFTGDASLTATAATTTNGTAQAAASLTVTDAITASGSITGAATLTVTSNITAAAGSTGASTLTATSTITTDGSVTLPPDLGSYAVGAMGNGPMF